MITGIFALSGVVLSAVIEFFKKYYSDKRKDKERLYEEKKIIYLNYIEVMTEYNGILVSSKLGAKPIKSEEEAFAKSVQISKAAAKVTLFGSKEVINSIMTIKDNEDAMNNLPKIIEIMQKDLGINK